MGKVSDNIIKKYDNMIKKHIILGHIIRSVFPSFFLLFFLSFFHCSGERGWSGGVMVMGKLSVPGRPTNLNYRRVRAYCAYSRCGWRLFGYFSLVYHFSSFSLSLGDGPI